MTLDPSTGPGWKCKYCKTGRSSGKIHRIVLWLSAICIASFAIGFGILAWSGAPLIQDGLSVPFNGTMLHSPETTVIPLDGIYGADIAVKFGTGELKVNAGSDNYSLLKSTAYAEGPGGKPVIRIVPATKLVTPGPWKSVDIDYTQPGENNQVSLIIPKVLDISLNPHVPMALSVRSGAGDTRLDIGSLNLTALTVSAGPGDMNIDLSNYKGGDFTGTVNHHAGDLTVRVSKEGNVTIALEQGIGHISNKGLVTELGAYRTGGNDPTQPEIFLTIEQGAGSVNLEAV